MTKKYKNTKAGFSLVEMLMYLAILIICFVFIISIVLSFTKPYKKLNASRDISYTARITMRVFVKDIRAANKVIESSSNLGVNDGKIVLDHGDYNTTFYIDRGKIKMDKKGETYVLNDNGVSAEILRFQYSDNPHSGVVRAHLRLSKKKQDIDRSMEFKASSVLWSPYTQ